VAIADWRTPRLYLSGGKPGTKRFKIDWCWWDDEYNEERHHTGHYTEAARAAFLKAGCERMEKLGLEPLKPERKSRVAMTVREVLAQYHEEHHPNVRPSTRQRYDEHRDILVRSPLGPMQWRRVDEKALAEFGTWARKDWKERSQRTGRGRRPTAKPLEGRTVKKHLSYLRGAFNHVLPTEAHVFKTITRDTRKKFFPKEIAAGTYIPMEDLVEKIVPRLPLWLRNWVMFARVAPTRKGELSNLRREWKRGKNIEINVSKTRAHVMPLTDEMRQYLPPASIKREGLLFVGPRGNSIYGSLQKPWKKACRAAGFPTLRPNDLRHSALTDLCSVPGADLIAIAEAAGTSVTMLEKVYAKHLTVERARGSFEKAEAARQTRRGEEAQNA
jgi:integrase